MQKNELSLMNTRIKIQQGKGETRQSEDPVPGLGGIQQCVSPDRSIPAPVKNDDRQDLVFGLVCLVIARIQSRDGGTVEMDRSADSYQ